MDRSAFFTAALFLVLVPRSASRADVLRVPQQHASIAGAIQAAADGDEVLVAAGEHLLQETLSFQGKTIILRSEAGADVTILRKSAALPGAESIGVVELTNGEGKDTPAVIDGFTLTGGSPPAPGIGLGGGILCRSSVLTVRNCTISGNEAGSGGGIAALSGASVSFEDTRIEGNVVRTVGPSGMGAAVYCEEASIVMSRCTVERNEAHGGGAAIDLVRTLGSFADCTVKGNLAAAGIHAGNSEAGLDRCRIIDHPGTGVSTSLSPLELRGCELSGNRIGFACANDSPGLADCTLARNVQAAIVAGPFSIPLIDHCTIAGNAGTGLEVDDSAAPTIKSSIVWDNVGGSLRASSLGTASTSFLFSCVEGEDLPPGEENTNVDPRFCGWGRREAASVDRNGPVDGDGSKERPFRTLTAALEFDLALGAGSPCLGTGEGGTDRGAAHGTCVAPGEPSRLILVAPGLYSFEGRTLAHHARILGEGMDLCVVEGPMLGLRTGASVFGLTVARGEYGIIVGPTQAPHIEMVTVTETSTAILCRANSRAEIDRCVVTENDLGLACEDASPVVNASSFSSNFGVGISCSGESSPSVADCDIMRNGDTGIALSGGSANFVRCRITGNRDTGFGAGISVRGGSSSFADCEISRNGGSALFCREDGSATLERCVISGNDSRTTQGAISCEGTSPVLVNCLVEANRGGGVVARGILAEPVVIHCTVTGNEKGGVICSEGAMPALSNSIVWGNSLEGVCGNLVATLTDEDPRFIRRAVVDFNRSFDEGFVVEEGDYSLQEGSPAIDAGELRDTPAVDLAGNGRPCEAGMDLGAYESGGCSSALVPFVRGDANGDASLDLSDAVAVLGFLFLGGEGPGCLESADLDDNGNLDLSDPIYLLNFLFLGGSEPEPPFEGCDVDPRVDSLGCEFYAPCEPT